ncbi:uncharacterized protein METZ01_LOCUS256596 [marine metagenome]|uniref:Uncharacterized protein n=1 Tax=marine metagenome TaxID=408172 RepID=A0A382IX53_9ZZZZ
MASHQTNFIALVVQYADPFIELVVQECLVSFTGNVKPRTDEMRSTR